MSSAFPGCGALRRGRGSLWIGTCRHTSENGLDAGCPDDAPGEGQTLRSRSRNTALSQAPSGVQRVF
jgi:hypothetical protein